MRPFTLDLDLGPLPADLTEVDHEIGGRLDPYEPELTRRDGSTWISITVGGGDLWQAVLLAMAAVTSTGYPVRRLHAQPLHDRAAGRRSRPA